MKDKLAGPGATVVRSTISTKEIIEDIKTNYCTKTSLISTYNDEGQAGRSWGNIWQFHLLCTYLLLHY